MKSSPVLLTIFLAAIFGGIASAPGQQRPSLEVPTLDSSGVVELLVRGDRGTNYAIDASTDLTVWWKLFSGGAASGQTQFTYVPPPGSGERYFRARVDVPLPPLNVTVQPDTNNVDVALLTPDRNATLSLTDDNGTTYTLTVPTNAVTDAQVFYMTSVTNLAGLPFAAGQLGAISLEPAGLVLQSPAQLEITFPTNLTINSSSVAAYAFDQDGSFLRLTLAYPDTNRITLPVFTLTGFGCSVATLSEVEQLSQRPVGESGNGSAALQSLVHHGAAGKQDYPLDDCHPEQLKRAVAVERIIKKSFDQLDSDLTFNALQTLQRVSGLTGDPRRWNVPWLGNEADFWSDFYWHNIDPFVKEAEHNCALTQVMERQIAVLDRLENDFGVPSFELNEAHGSLCSGYLNCIKTIDECCKEKGLGGEAAVNAAQGFANKAHLLNCSDSPISPAQIASDCQPTWSGFIDVETTRSYTNVVVAGPVSSVVTSKEDCFLLCYTDSNGLAGESAGLGYYGIKGPLKVGAFCFFNETIVTTDTSCCSPCVTTVTDKAMSSKTAGANCAFIWKLINSPPSPFPVPLLN